MVVGVCPLCRTSPLAGYGHAFSNVPPRDQDAGARLERILAELDRELGGPEPAVRRRRTRGSWPGRGVKSRK